MYRGGDHSRLSERGDPLSHNYRSPFHEDLSRLIHSPSLRRLSRKKQLLPDGDNDFVRNRLSHSVEVSDVCERICRKLSASLPSADMAIDNDIMRFAGLAHDIGLPPFGHRGEQALNECMKPFGGFEGNAQTFRLLTSLEKRYDPAMLAPDPGVPVGENWASEPAPDAPSYIYQRKNVGLDLTARTLASIIKYDTCIPQRPSPTPAKLTKGYYADDEPSVERIKAAVLQRKEVPKKRMDEVLGVKLGDHIGNEIEKILDAGKSHQFKTEIDNLVEHVEILKQRGIFKTVEAQIMDLADDISYSTYDLEDCLQSGVMSIADVIDHSAETLDRLRPTLARLLIEKAAHINAFLEVLAGAADASAPRYDPLRAELRQTIQLLGFLLDPARSVEFYPFASMHLVDMVIAYYTRPDERVALAKALFENYFDFLLAKPGHDGDGRRCASEAFEHMSNDAGHIADEIAFHRRLGSEIANDSRTRRTITHILIYESINDVEIVTCDEFPALSLVYQKNQSLFRIELLKEVNRAHVLDSIPMRTYDFRTREIVQKLFEVYIGTFLDRKSKLEGELQRPQERKEPVSPGAPTKTPYMAQPAFDAALLYLKFLEDVHDLKGLATLRLLPNDISQEIRDWAAWALDAFLAALSAWDGSEKKELPEFWKIEPEQSPSAETFRGLKSQAIDRATKILKTLKCDDILWKDTTPATFRNGLFEAIDELTRHVARVICDHIANMTDRHALQTYRNLFDEDPRHVLGRRGS